MCHTVAEFQRAYKKIDTTASHHKDKIIQMTSESFFKALKNNNFIYAIGHNQSDNPVYAFYRSTIQDYEILLF